MESDQFQIYKSIEGILQTMGINGIGLASIIPSHK